MQRATTGLYVSSGSDMKKSEMTKETVQHIHGDAPQYLANQGKKLKLTIDISKDLKTKHGVKT